MKKDKEVDIDREYSKRITKKPKLLFEPITEKPYDFESNIFIAAKYGKL